MKILYKFGDKNLTVSKIQNQDYIEIDGEKIKTCDIILPEQTHSKDVYIADEKDKGAGVCKDAIPSVDALITDKKKVFVAVKTADCVPIIIYDELREVVAAVHSGREGTRKNIVGETLKILMQNYKCKPENIIIKLGAGICGKCQEVGQDVFNEFTESTKIPQQFPFIDNYIVILQNIIDTGVLEENIEVSEICTLEDEQYYSFRRDGTKERQISLIGILKIN
jgi:YfiH family protein